MKYTIAAILALALGFSVSLATIGPHENSTCGSTTCDAGDQQDPTVCWHWTGGTKPGCVPGHSTCGPDYPPHAVTCGTIWGYGVDANGQCDKGTIVVQPQPCSTFSNCG